MFVWSGVPFKKLQGSTSNDNIRESPRKHYFEDTAAMVHRVLSFESYSENAYSYSSLTNMVTSGGLDHTAVRLYS